MKIYIQIVGKKKTQKPNKADATAAFLSTVISEMCRHNIVSFILMSEKEKQKKKKKI